MLRQSPRQSVRAAPRAATAAASAASAQAAHRQAGGHCSKQAAGESANVATWCNAAWRNDKDWAYYSRGAYISAQRMMTHIPNIGVTVAASAEDTATVGTETGLDAKAVAAVARQCRDGRSIQGGKTVHVVHAVNRGYQQQVACARKSAGGGGSSMLSQYQLCRCRCKSVAAGRHA